PKQNICLYDVGKGSLHKEWADSSQVYELAFDGQNKNDGKSKSNVPTRNLMSLAVGGKPLSWPVPEGNKSAAFEGPANAAVTLFEGSPDGKNLVLSGPSGVFLWDVPGKKGMKLFHRGGRGLAFSADSQKLLYHYGSHKDEKPAVKVRDL